MTELYVKLLRDAGLTVDWKTVAVGWHGFSGVRMGYFSLPSSQLQEYALECLATASLEEEDLLFRIADDDDSWKKQDTEYALETLSARTTITEEMAYRKWRYAWLMTYSRAFTGYTGDDPHEKFYDQEAIYEACEAWELEEEWLEWSKSSEGVGDSLSHLRQWLELEAETLRKAIGEPVS